MSEFVSWARLPVADGVGTVGFTVIGADGAELAARSTAGVYQLHEGDDFGIYAALVSLDEDADAATVVWDDGAGNATARNASDFDPIIGGEVLSAVTLPIVDGVGTVGYQLFDSEGEESDTRITAGIEQLYEGDDYGIYQATIDPDDLETGYVLFDDGDGNVAARAFAVGSGPVESAPDTSTVLRLAVVSQGAMVELDELPALESPGNSYGVLRTDTSEEVVESGAEYNEVGTGFYSYTFADPAADLVYRYYVRAVYGDVTYFLPRSTAVVASAMLAIGRYTDSTKIEQKFGTENVYKWLALEPGDMPIDFALRASAFIDGVCDEIDDALRGSAVSVPITGTTPASIVEIATALAGVRMYESRGVTEANPDTGQSFHRLAYWQRWAENQLKRLRAGSMRLAGQVATRFPQVIE